MATQTTNLLTFRPAKRIQQSVSAAYEKRLLIWMAERTPAWINSDHLTSLGFAAQLLTGAAYAMSGFSRAWLVAAIAFLALNWLGDSLDGTLARVRQHQRPRYGFYVDHILDSIGSVALMGGLALSGYMSPLIAVHAALHGVDEQSALDRCLGYAAAEIHFAWERSFRGFIRNELDGPEQANAADVADGIQAAQLV